jgi:hypothetical protein
LTTFISEWNEENIGQKVNLTNLFVSKSLKGTYTLTQSKLACKINLQTPYKAFVLIDK